ncbi:MAG: hypothetical protein P4M00_25605, partial [Azospirillaceae bacterium]|nr:hypothetical protein [Azospirillaceae bacterium]
MITFAPAIRFLVLSSVLLAAHTAHATMTCAVPPTSPAGHSYYVDPVNGSMANDGSSSAPWSNLQAVLNSGLVASLYYKTYVTGASLSGPHPNAVVEAGDTIHLRSGNYGAIKVANAYNDGFVTIAAETGQTPVFSSLVVEGAAKWIFQGITV